VAKSKQSNKRSPSAANPKARPAPAGGRAATKAPASKAGKGPAKPSAGKASASKPPASKAAAGKVPAGKAAASKAAAKVVAKPTAGKAAKPTAGKVPAKAASAKAPARNPSTPPAAPLPPAPPAARSLAATPSKPAKASTDKAAGKRVLAAHNPVEVTTPQLQAALLAALEVALSSARAAHHAAVEGATHEEARPENDKDTRGLEQSYLARGHAQRVAELEAGIAAVEAMPLQPHLDDEAITVGAIISVDEEGHRRRFFLAPAGGGLVLPGEVAVVTPTSPLGRALLGRAVDDECEVVAGGHQRFLTVVAIR
jgi:transcription elongation GreA/GreB family factor